MTALEVIDYINAYSKQNNCDRDDIDVIIVDGGLRLKVVPKDVRGIDYYQQSVDNIHRFLNIGGDDLKPLDYECMKLIDLVKLRDSIIRKIDVYDREITMFTTAKAHYKENLERIDSVIKTKE